MPAQAAIADYLQHGGYDRHLRKLRYALEEQQSAMLGGDCPVFPGADTSQSASGRLLFVARIAGTDGFIEVVPDGVGARDQHCARADIFASAALQELHSAELWQPVG